MAMLSHRGFTLFECLIAVTVAAVMVSLSIPATIQFLARNRIIAAAEALAGDLKLARSAALRHGAPVYVHYQTGTDWCGGLHDAAVCDCNNPDSTADSACTLPSGDVGMLYTTISGNYPGVQLRSTSFSRNVTSFDPVRGVARPGALHLLGYKGMELQVVLSLLGRVRICAVPGPYGIHRYPTC